MKIAILSERPPYYLFYSGVKHSNKFVWYFFKNNNHISLCWLVYVVEWLRHQHRLFPTAFGGEACARWVSMILKYGEKS